MHMVIEDRAKKTGRKQMEILKEFRRSQTFGMLFDPDFELWMNGPDYISDEYDMEIERMVKG